MLSLLLWALVFVGSLALLVKASDVFTDSAERIGVGFGISPFIIGVTIVAVGTSTPELVSSVLAVMKGSPEIVAGNVMGSNVTNIFLILGISAIVGKKMVTSYQLANVDLPLFVGSAFLVSLMVMDGAFSVAEALLCLACLLVYLVYAVRAERVADRVKERFLEEEGIVITEKRRPDLKIYAKLSISLFFLYIGANYTVVSVVRLSEMVGIGTEIIAASAVALGTSLPELVVSVRAAAMNKPELAVGNILGSNIFNALGIMGISALFGTLVISETITGFVMPMMIVATLLYFVVIWEKEITQWEGWMLVIFYVFFLGKLFALF
ncbi:calcium/sodium antiporter [Candidatus Methanocrinis natronophilus]|uniref:Calcium/sodium antiporter n=1 Tax=Candidatus Methanocrinis natronophilus TaxID=3033396 RepID=A0ABT5X9D6_9EURY|nr:calcium/sodium antiporter [Candidatus Methanocrinis natronophilus]MDF0591278.1 calcium/sodium antiporter [Candidatus Methanocrinis natronophilus]